MRTNLSREKAEEVYDTMRVAEERSKKAVSPCEWCRITHDDGRLITLIITLHHKRPQLNCPGNFLWPGKGQNNEIMNSVMDTQHSGIFHRIPYLRHDCHSCRVSLHQNDLHLNYVK